MDTEAGLAPSSLQSFMMPDGLGGQRHAVLHAPDGRAPSALVVHAQAFGAEMNASRRQVTLAARAMAQAGVAVLVIDLAGCGDSSGDAADADWDRWAGDLRRAARHLRQLAPDAPLWWWGLRAGALVAVQAAAAEYSQPPQLLWWQPISEGSELRRHWQRQALAAAVARGRDGPAASAALAAAWDAGCDTEVAGTLVTAALASAATRRSHERTLATAAPGRVVWIDVAPRPRPAPSPAVAARCEAWRAAGWRMDWLSVAGPSFWQSPEIETVPALTEATLQAVLGTTAVP